MAIPSLLEPFTTASFSDWEPSRTTGPERLDSEELTCVWTEMSVARQVNVAERYRDMMDAKSAAREELGPKGPVVPGPIRRMNAKCPKG